MNDFYAMLRVRMDREQAARNLRNTQFAQDALANEKARPRWPRFSLASMIARWLAKADGVNSPAPLPPCGERPVSAR